MSVAIREDACENYTCTSHDPLVSGVHMLQHTTPQVVRRTWDWLAEQPEDAAELAVLLYEAAPKLNISSASAGGASRKVPTRSP